MLIDREDGIIHYCEWAYRVIRDASMAGDRTGKGLNYVRLLREHEFRYMKCDPISAIDRNESRPAGGIVC